jgi:hypothetical protein
MTFSSTLIACIPSTFSSTSALFILLCSTTSPWGVTLELELEEEESYNKNIFVSLFYVFFLYWRCLPRQGYCV